jgi:hypothetical protein
MRYKSESLKPLFEIETVEEVAAALGTCRLTVRKWKACESAINSHQAYLIKLNFPWIKLQHVNGEVEDEDDFSDLEPSGKICNKGDLFMSSEGLERLEDAKKFIQQEMSRFFREEIIPALDVFIEKKLREVAKV